MKGKTKVSKLYNILLRLLIIVLTWGFIYKKVFHDKDFSNIHDFFLSFLDQEGITGILILVILMMPVNWGIEAVKWRYLIKKIEKISFVKSFEAVLTGSSISFFTPNRVGEYFGRVFILEKGDRLEGVILTILGSTSQLMITIFTGTLALILVKPQLVPEIAGYPGLLYSITVATVISLDILLILFYFNVSLLSGFGRSFIHSRFGKYLRILRVLKKFSTSELLTVLLLSFSRYIVFSLQYYLLLKVFSVPVPFFDGMVIISLVFLVITLLPTIALTELGIRDSAALYLFGLYFSVTGTGESDSMIAILSATTFLWFLNLVLPAITGTIFVYRLKFFRKTKVESGKGDVIS